jgi:hypothetical protein
LVRNNSLLYSKFFPLDKALEQIKFEIWRYKLIGEKEGALKGYAKGLEEAVAIIYKNILSNEYRFTDSVYERIFKIEETCAKIADFVAQHRIRRLLIHSVGKLLHIILQYLFTLNLEEILITDPNHAMHGKELFGVKIYSLEQIKKENFDAILCGSSSLAINDEVEEAVKRSSQFRKKPFLRLCDYEYL